MKIGNWSAAALILVAVASAASAQPATIQYTITEQNGGLRPRAMVMVYDTEYTGSGSPITYSSPSDFGQGQINGITPGHYTMIQANDPVCESVTQFFTPADGQTYVMNLQVQC